MVYTATHELLMDIAMLLILVAMYIGLYIYGRYEYNRGYHEGLREKRKIEREIRRGNIYRLK